MRAKLNAGRRKGRDDYDRHWPNSQKPNIDGFLFGRLQQEVAELAVALHNGDVEEIVSECADIANFAMFIADVSMKGSNSP